MNPGAGQIHGPSSASALGDREAELLFELARSGVARRLPLVDHPRRELPQVRRLARRTLAKDERRAGGRPQIDLALARRPRS